ncbi:glycosyltransferase [Gloeobacter kilaueensis]|uniref:Glycosyl transferase family 2 n=1 Tax=Gloeobacter kilaueensis (strain ATCC BAA-2537 / CCAP 1431/1 / ULC 316 / JS1) TaxID=1183438 RepID=U5QI69_GLOK1|nr:glycosyltransferase [Gloeobacter kilaueensis]AGY58636.1 glycosyl transferase family 2 [Gloeobacter kilaueensis JS1]
MSIALSVVIAAHNPRAAYLEEVLESLKGQSLAPRCWELLLVDNASCEPLADAVDLSWHPQARHIREEQLGVVHARSRGLGESCGEIVVFVDDDNVLESSYLEMAVQIGQDYPRLGIWGGQVLPRFESEPPLWTRPLWPLLAIRQFDRDRWSNLDQSETMPVGAGMCLRRTVARKYLQLIEADPRRLQLGRQGDLLMSCEDFDMALTALDLGLGAGLFTRLQLTHLIPAERLGEAYLLRLVKGIVYSTALLDYLRGREPEQLPWRTRLRYFLGSLLMPARERRFLKATKSAQTLAKKQIETMRAAQERLLPTSAPAENFAAH